MDFFVSFFHYFILYFVFTCNVLMHFNNRTHILLSSVKIGFTKKCCDFFLRDDDDANLKMEKNPQFYYYN